MTQFFQYIGPADASNPGFLTNQAQVLGGFKEWVVPHISGIDFLGKWRLDEDTNAFAILENNSSADGVFRTQFRGVASNVSDGPALTLVAQHALDTGVNGLMQLKVRINAGTAVTTRPYFDLYNNSNLVLQALPLNSGANAALSWGSQAGAAPSTGARSTGTRLIFYAPGVLPDYTLGVNTATGRMWSTVASTGAGLGWDWQAGANTVLSVESNGKVTYTGGQVKKTRVALTSPVTVAVTDWYVESNLSSAGAVAVSLPSSPTTGTEFVVKDGKGDAATNNVTITPAAGNIDGAATKVISTNYGAVRLLYNGTQWVTI